MAMNEPPQGALPSFGGFVAPHPAKLIFMSIASLGLYQVYWLYENWVAMDRTHYKHVIPWLRTPLYFFFTLSNFQWIEKEAMTRGIRPTLKPTILFLLFLGLSISLDPWGLSSLLNCLPLLYANALIIRARQKDDKDFRAENVLHTADYSVVALGIAFYVTLYIAEKFVSSLSSDASLVELLPPDQRQLLSILSRF